MIHPIVRLYANLESANEAVAGLRNWGFTSDLINVVTASSTQRAESATASDDTITGAIMAGYVLRAHARIYAESIRNGAVLVSIQAPFGTGAMASEILDASAPIASGITDQPEHGPLWDDKAPLSSALWLPILMKNPSPFSSFWSLPTLVRSGATFGSALGLPEVSDSAGGPDTSLGLPTLSQSPATLSERFGLPLLSR